LENEINQFIRTRGFITPAYPYPLALNPRLKGKGGREGNRKGTGKEKEVKDKGREGKRE
jgi:hypothetical protein